MHGKHGFAADGLQHPLPRRSRFQPRLKPIVRPWYFNHPTEQLSNGIPLEPKTTYNGPMDIVYQLQGVEFEWDEDKARSNVEDHGVTFEEAAEVFFDPFYQGGNASTDDEQRDFIIGYSPAQRLLLIVYLERGTRTRIISAHRTTRYERKLYEEA